MLSTFLFHILSIGNRLYDMLNLIVFGYWGLAIQLGQDCLGYVQVMLC